MTETDPLRAAADTMREVRDRCVWTQQIDHRALVPYLVEESAELIDAVETGSRAELREELGDLLWQVLFHSEIASRDPDAPFDIDDVARGLTEKMVRRHPHVFAGEVAETPEQVLVLWNAAKAAEKAGDTVKAAEYYKKVVAIAGDADKSRVEVGEARAFLTRKS